MWAFWHGENSRGTRTGRGRGAGERDTPIEQSAWLRCGAFGELDQAGSSSSGHVRLIQVVAVSFDRSSPLPDSSISMSMCLMRPNTTNGRGSPVAGPFALGKIDCSRIGTFHV